MGCKHTYTTTHTLYSWRHYEVCTEQTLLDAGSRKRTPSVSN